MQNPFGSHVTDYKHSDFIHTLAWSPDGKRIASSGQDHELHIWDANNGKFYVRYCNARGRINSLAWSPKRPYIATGSTDKIVRIYDLDHGRITPLYMDYISEVNVVAWSPNGNLLAAGNADGSIQVWNLDNPGENSNYQGHMNKKARGWFKNKSGVQSLAWSPDSMRIASVGEDRIVRIWKVGPGDQIQEYKGHEQKVNAIAWSAKDEGKVIASADDSKVHIWNPENGQRIYELLPPEKSYTQVDRGTNTEEVNKGIPAIILAIDWSREGESLAFALGNLVYVFEELLEGAIPSVYREHASLIRSIAWSPSKENKHIASAGDDKIVHVWETLNPHQNPGPSSGP